MAYEVKILADSVSPAGHRLTTCMGTFPRLILAEVNTTRQFGRNSASSRAIPVAKKIAAVEEDMFIPAAFGRNQKGMQHSEVLSGDEAEAARARWVALGRAAIETARELADMGVHKQYANRVLDPWSWHTAIITATDWDNHEHQRVNPAAMGEYQVFASMLRDARNASAPVQLKPGEWHLPLVERMWMRDTAGGAKDVGEAYWLTVNGFDPVKVSVARCARVSGLTHEGKRDPAADVTLYDYTLAAKGHMSPLEHAARPMDEDELKWTRAYDVSLVNGPTLRTARFRDEPPAVGTSIVLYSGRKATIARVRGPLHYAGPFNGWISQRQLVHGEEDILGYRGAHG